MLTLTDAYVFGTNITATDFVSLVYNSSDQFQDITSTSLLMGGVNADGSIALDNLFIRGPSNYPQFGVTDGGDWQVMPNATMITTDLGTDGNFAPAKSSAIPEPSTWALMLLGFVGLCFRSFFAAYGRARVFGSRFDPSPDRS